MLVISVTILLVVFFLFHVACISAKYERKSPNDLSEMDNMPVFNHSNKQMSSRNLDLENQINIFRSQKQQSVHRKSLNSNTPIFQLNQESIFNISNITIGSNFTSSSNLGSFYVYVASNVPDGPGDPSNCDETSTVALPTCNLRSAWSLCDKLVAIDLDRCSQTNRTLTGVVVCTVILPIYSVTQLSEIYGDSLNLAYVTPVSACHAEFRVISSEPSLSVVFNTPSYPIVQGDPNAIAPNMFIEIYDFPYISIYLQSLMITGFNDGALYFLNIGAARIEDCHFSYNGYSKLAGSFGGAILCDHCSLVDISRSSFSYNQVSFNKFDIWMFSYYTQKDAWWQCDTNCGGGGAVAIFASPTVVITNSSFNSCLAGQGGALLCHNCSALSVVNSSFYNNSAGLDGGAVYYLNSGNFVESSDTNVFQLNNSLFTGNSALAGNGGSVYLQFASSIGNATITSCLFNSSVAQFSGGALAVLSSEVNNAFLIKSSNFSDNIAANDFGGSIFVVLTTPLIIECQFMNNSAPGNGGGAVYYRGSQFFSSSVKLTISFENCLFKKNNGYFGGAIMTYMMAILYVSKSTFISNAATYGGAIGNYLFDFSIVR